MDTFHYNDEQCCNADHRSAIDSLYMHIANSLFNSGIRICLVQKNITAIGLSLAGTSMLLNSMPRQEVVM